MPVVNISVGVRITAVTMSFVLSPLPMVEVTIFKLKPALATMVVFLPIAFIFISIWPDILSESMLVIVLEKAYIIATIIIYFAAIAIGQSIITLAFIQA
jgi:hypothetical protein